MPHYSDPQNDKEEARRVALARAAKRRDRHHSRFIVGRALTVIAGLLLTTVGFALVLWLPEVGLPAVLAGLRLLALEFEWAARAQAGLKWRVRELRQWFRGKSAAVESIIVIVLSALLLAIIWVILYWTTWQ